MVMTTGGPPPPGISWQALIFDSFTLAADTEIRMKNIPDAQFNMSVQPSIQMRPPSKFRLRVAPMIEMDGGNNEAAQFGISVNPRIRWIPSAAFKASVTPMIAMGGKPKSTGLFGLHLTPSVAAAGVGLIPPAYEAVGTGASSSATGTQTISFTDTVPSDAKCALLWAVNSSSAANPTISAKVGSANATLVSSTLITTNGAYIYITCFAVLNPPTGSQTISFTTTANYVTSINTAYYKNVSSIGTPITLGNQTTVPASITAPSTRTNYLYANAFAYQTGGYGYGFSAYNQNQRFMQASTASSYPMLFGDALGSGGALTFSATRALTTYNWGGIIVPLIGLTV